MVGSRSSLRGAISCVRLVPMMALALAIAGCPKSDEGKKEAPAASASAPARPSASTSASATPPDAGGKPAAEGATYTGTYSVSPGTYYIPSAKDYGSVKQAKDDPTKHVGEGTLTLSVDSEGKVTGTFDTGPASPGVVEGSVIDGELRGFIRRKDPKDEGLTGTFIAKESDANVEGKLSLAEANAAIVREGKFSLKKK